MSVYFVFNPSLIKSPPTPVPHVWQLLVYLSLLVLSSTSHCPVTSMENLQTLCSTSNRFSITLQLMSVLRIRKATAVLRCHKTIILAVRDGFCLTGSSKICKQFLGFINQCRVHDGWVVVLAIRKCINVPTLSCGWLTMYVRKVICRLTLERIETDC